MERPSQETTSIYFNDILKRGVVPVSVDELPVETIENFNRIIDVGFADEAEVVKKRIRYIIPYILQSIE